MVQVDPNMRHLLSEVSSTTGQRDIQMFDQQQQQALPLPTHETHLMPSEEEEEEDEESEFHLQDQESGLDHQTMAMAGDYPVGDHLAGQATEP